MKPQDPPPATGPDFAARLNVAAVGYSIFKQTQFHALGIGVRPADLVRYVAGNLVVGEQGEIEALLVQAPWAMERVVALVKARRDPTSLGAQILAGEFNPYAYGVQRTEDPEMDAATLLNLI